MTIKNTVKESDWRKMTVSDIKVLTEKKGNLNIFAFQLTEDNRLQIAFNTKLGTPVKLAVFNESNTKFVFEAIAQLKEQLNEGSDQP